MNELYGKVKSLEELLVAAATGGGMRDADYQALRAQLVSDPVVGKGLPPFVRQARDLSQFWSFISQQASTYRERRELLWAAFRPLLDQLEQSVSSVTPIPTCWASGKFRLFISHVSAHKILAKQIQDAILIYHTSAFVAHADIEPTLEWQHEIEAALRTADAIVALLTPEFHDSRWTDQEVGIGFGRGLLVIPIRLGLDPYGFIGKYQGLQGLGRKPAWLAAATCRILARHPLTRRRFAEVLVAAFESSSGWDVAKENMSLLERLGNLDEDLLRRAEAAVDDNYEVSSAYGVRERLRRLAERIRSNRSAV